jgi:thiol-disulfide isomerase/thioredoxin
MRCIVERRHRAGALARGALWSVLIAALLVGCATGRVTGHATLKPGDQPPDIVGRTEAGEPVRLSDCRGKLVVVSFWASWCPPCRRELPVLVNLQRLATRETVVVFSIVFRENRAEFRRLQKILKGSDLTLVDDESGDIGHSYDVTAIPHMIIIGRDGKIAAIHLGYSEAEIPRLAAEIKALWSQSAPQSP